MSSRTIQVLLLLLMACLHQSTSTEKKVNTRWTYNDKNTKSSPDSIQMDLDLENDKVTLNLIKQKMDPPLVMTQSEGQRAIWSVPEDEFMGIYKDFSHDASATVAITNVDNIKQVSYRMTFSCGGFSYIVAPKIDSPLSDETEEEEAQVPKTNKKERNETEALLNIEGTLYSLYKTPTSRKGHSRGIHKRSEENITKRLMTNEVLTVIDFSTFTKFFAKSKATSDAEKREDAMKSILYIFTHMMEGVKELYESIDTEGLRFTVKWIGMLIAESAEDVPFVENEISKENPSEANFHVILTNLKDWISSENAKQIGKLRLPNHDSLVLFTSYQDINMAGGMAFVDRVCTSLSLSVVHYSDCTITTPVIAHELGHGLGMQHDGTGNKCSSESSFIMAERQPFYSESSFNNTFIFSECSVSYLRDTIQKLDSEKRNCLLDGSNDFIDGREKDFFLKLYPGQLYDLDEQCQMVHGPNAYYLRDDESDENVCHEIRCHNESNYLGQAMHRAMDGTSCSNRAWCHKGKCVPDDRAPRVPDRCINGDTKFQDPKYSCRNIISQNRNLCNVEHIKKLCCASCDGQRTLDGSCQDFIDECITLEPRDCYNEYYATTCCKTCSALVLNPTDGTCLYGDKGVNCPDLVPEVCHLSNRFCCQTCATHRSSTNGTKITTKLPTSTTTNYVPTTTTSPPTTTTTKSTTTLPTTTSTTSSPHKTPTLPNPKAGPTTDPTKKITGDFNGTLEYVDVTGNRLYLNCRALVKYASNLCYDEAVQKYCSASCRNVNIVSTDYCMNGDYHSKSFDCKKFVKNEPDLCDVKEFKTLCCKTCGSVAVRAVQIRAVNLE